MLHDVCVARCGGFIEYEVVGEEMEVEVEGERVVVGQRTTRGWSV
jgi:hypothetical protein